MLDFAPDLDYYEMLEYFSRQKKRTAGTKLYLADTLMGLLNGKLIPVVLGEAGQREDMLLSLCGEQELERVIRTMKNFRIDIVGSKGFDSAQVCAGGVLTAEIEPKTMESQLVPGLYFAGEAVDIDGMCGGYNLQWAWSSGWVAGHSAGEDGGSL